MVALESGGPLGSGLTNPFALYSLLLFPASCLTKGLWAPGSESVWSRAGLKGRETLALGYQV